MDDKNAAISLSSLAVLVGFCLTVVGIGLAIYLAVRPPETRSETATRAVATQVPVATEVAVETIDPPPLTPETGPSPTEADVEPTSLPDADPDPDPGHAVAPWAMQQVRDTVMSSGSPEFSAVALNEESNRLVIADDENRLFEYDLAADGLPSEPPRRVLRVAAGAGDIEGIAWMFANTYVLAHENDGRLTVVEINEDTTTLTDDDVVRTIDTGIRELNGNGLEGVAYLGQSSGEIEFIVVDERPAALVLISSAGAIVSTIELDLIDASDVWASSATSVSVLSDDERVLVELRLDEAGMVEIVDRTSLVLPDGRFEQPEGVVQDQAQTRLYVVGEAPGPGRYSFGLWIREPSSNG